MARVTQEFPPLLWICLVWGNKTKHFILFSLLSGFKCPICSKSVASDEMEMHFIMCLSKPRLSYNGEGLVGVGGGGVGSGQLLHPASQQEGQGEWGRAGVPPEVVRPVLSSTCLVPLVSGRETGLGHPQLRAEGPWEHQLSVGKGSPG